jgi:hypothetical protein
MNAVAVARNRIATPTYLECTSWYEPYCRLNRSEWWLAEA